jgi:hypothetical protein
MNLLKSWWGNHVQKTLGSILVVLSGADLGTLALYQQDLAHFIGVTWTAHALAGAKLVCGAAIFLRAVQVKKQ